MCWEEKDRFTAETPRALRRACDSRRTWSELPSIKHFEAAGTISRPRRVGLRGLCVSAVHPLPLLLGDQGVDHARVFGGADQALVQALVGVVELVRVQAEQVEDGGLKVVHVDLVFD